MTRSSCSISRTAFCAIVSLVSLAQLGAQAGDSTLLARADSLTVGDYCRVTTHVVAQPTVVTALAGERAIVTQALAKVCDTGVAALRLRELTATGAATLPAVARLRQGEYHDILRTPLDSAMAILGSRLRGSDMRPVVKAALGDTANTTFFTVTETARLMFVREARDRSLMRLAHYERKLGLQSPKLNGVEVLLNYAAQRWVPGFAATVTKGPSPLEVITSYVPTYGTYANKTFVAASASEFGIRHYMFGSDWGATGWRGLLRPAYVSAGLLVASNRAGALVAPWDGSSRSGAFIGWGETKVAWVPGRTGALLITRQVQFIPFAF